MITVFKEGNIDDKAYRTKDFVDNPATNKQLFMVPFNDTDKIAFWSMCWIESNIKFYVWDISIENGWEAYTFPEKIECVLCSMNPWKDN